MSSIIMHIYISQKVQNEFNLSNRFLAGSILPDIIKIAKGDKKGTHYMKKFGNKELPDLEKFLRDNKYNLKDEVMLGYYAHLIEDRIWYDTYIDSFAKCIDEKNVLYVSDNTVHDNKEFLEDLYSDYSCVENYLIGTNNLDIDKIRSEIKQQLKDYDMDNVIDEYVDRHIIYENKKINFISYDCLNNYINEAVEAVKERILKTI